MLTQDTYRGEQTDPGTWHLYAYCANNPINYVDPSGHLKKHWWNKTKYVGRALDAAFIFITGGKSYFASKALKKLIKEHKGAIMRATRNKMIKLAGKKYGYGMASVIDVALTVAGTSLGQVVARALDYADPWWGRGWKRSNGYIFN